MLKKSFIKKIREILETEKKRLIKKSYTDADINNDVDLDGDEFDEIQGNLLIGISNQLKDREIAKLIQIDKALGMLGDKDYGVCEDCGEDIPEKRLLINPCINICVACAEDRELEQLRRRN